MLLATEVGMFKEAWGQFPAMVVALLLCISFNESNCLKIVLGEPVILVGRQALALK